MSAPVYVTQQEIKASLSMQSYVFADQEIQEACMTASRAVDKACDRVFYLRDETNDEQRYYTPLRPMVLEIDDCVALTSVSVDTDGDGVFDTTWTLHTDFELQPDNADLDGRPWERIVAKRTGGTQFPYGLQRSVEVVGRFGWLATPDAVVTLTRLLAVQYAIRTRSAPFAVLGMGVDGAIRIAREDPAMSMLLRDLNRSPIFVG